MFKTTKHHNELRQTNKPIACSNTKYSLIYYFVFYLKKKDEDNYEERRILFTDVPDIKQVFRYLDERYIDSKRFEKYEIGSVSRFSHNPNLTIKAHHSISLHSDDELLNEDE